MAACIEKGGATLPPLRSASTGQTPADSKQWWTLGTLRKTLQAAAAAVLNDMNPALQGVAADITPGAWDRQHLRLSL